MYACVTKRLDQHAHCRTLSREEHSVNGLKATTFSSWAVPGAGKVNTHL